MPALGRDINREGPLETQPRVEIGRICDGYAVEAVLAEGANANVYLVRNTRRRTPHALKVLKRVDPRRKVRVEQEAILRDDLRHPNIAAASEVIEVDGQPALVMDLVQGPSLARWMDDDPPEDLGLRLALFRGIVLGCGHAHRHGVVHRDLKPSNVLLEKKDDGTWIPRVGDFGLARALAPEVGKFGGLTTVNTGLGTAGYASPEQVRDATTVDARADLYSLGCILYELVCGISPFAGLSAFDTIQAQREGRWRPPEELAPGLPPALYALIRDLMEVDRDRRPATAELVIERLDRLLADQPPAAPTAPIDDSRDDALELGPILVLCAIPLAAMLVGAVVVFLA